MSAVVAENLNRFLETFEANTEESNVAPSQGMAPIGPPWSGRRRCRNRAVPLSESA
jgi:hypothetical protein